MAPMWRDLARTLPRSNGAVETGAASLVAATSVALGLFQLGQPSLWIDEAATARAVRFSVEQLSAQHHWIYYSLMKPWTAVAGHSEFALRLPSVFAAALACALLVPLGNRLLGRPVGFLAGLLLALNPFVVQWSQQARSYTLVMLAAIVATAAFVYLRSRPTKLAWALYTLAAGTLLVLQPLCGALLLAVHLVAGPRARLHVVVSWIAVAAAASWWLRGVEERETTGGTLEWNTAPGLGTIVDALRELGGAAGVGLVVPAVALALVRRERLLLASWAFVPLVLSLVVTPLAKVFLDRYLIVSAPAFAMLVAAGLTSLGGLARGVAVAALVSGTVGGLAVWYGPDGSQNWRGEDWKAATAFANAHGGATVSSGFAQYAYDYYGGRIRDTGLVLVWSEDERDFAGDWPLDVSFGKRLRAQERG
jgi:mannosyltransferase